MNDLWMHLFGIYIGSRQGYILCKIQWLGGREWCREKNEKWGSEEQNEKEGKRGKKKEEKEKGESDFFGNIWHTSVDHLGKK